MKRTKISKEMNDEWVAKYLSSMGFDLDKEYTCHAEFREDGYCNQIYEQEDNAKPTKESALRKKLVERPAYLGERNES